jgi:IclR family pca regulon transcriptional regulator
MGKHLMNTTNEAELNEDIAGRGDLIGGLEKGLRLMEALTEPPGKWTVTQAAELAGFSRAATRRYMRTLVHTGHMQTDGKHFWLTARTLRFGDAYLTSSNLPRIVQPVVERLAFLAQDSASVGIIDGEDVVYIARSGNARVVSASLRPGSRCPLYCTAGGRILLGAMSAEECRSRLEHTRLVQCTAYTLTEVEPILREIVKARSQGYAVVDQEFEIGLRTVAVPMYGITGSVKGVIALTSRAQQMSAEQTVSTHLPILLEAQSLVRGLI